MTSGLPFDDIRNLVRQLASRDEAAAARVAQGFAGLPGGLQGAGRFAEIASFLAGWTGRVPPQVGRPVVAVFAGTHAIAASLPGGDVTQATVESMAAGGASVAQVCGAGDIGLKIFDLALEVPVADITQDAALDERGCAATIAFGMESIAGGTDLIVATGMGSGGEVGAAALFCALHGGAPAALLGDGKAAELAEAALAAHRGKLADPLEALRRLGGRETAAILGAIISARTEKVPVLLDGMVALSAAGALKAMNATAIDHCLLAHCGTEAERLMAAKLELEPVLDLGIAEGYGTGGALAVGIAKAAAQAAVGALAAS